MQIAARLYCLEALLSGITAATVPARPLLPSA
jgi:hypothetical protein